MLWASKVGGKNYFALFGLLIVSTVTSAVWLLALLRLTNLPVVASRLTVMVVARRDGVVARLELSP